MANRRDTSRPIEQPAVKTTIVGGRPPGPGKDVGDVPRGIEVLVKKAAVDADFRQLLLERRVGAADEIGLVLDPAEAMMLAAVPAAQLEAIIARTSVSPMTRAAFLGKAAAVMLAALGAEVIAAEAPATLGITPDHPPVRTTRRERYILYSETDWKGELSYGIADDAAYDEKTALLLKTSRVLRQAYLSASKAWSQDEATKSIPFPMKAPQRPQCSKLATYNDRERAEDMLKRGQEKLDKKLEEARKAEERRLAALSDEARAREQQKADLLKAAQALFERELRRLLAAGLLRPVLDLRDLRNDRPGASEGIRPDRP